MKKFVILLILAAAIGAGVYFYDPYLKPHLEPLFSKSDPEPVPADSPDSGGTGSADKPATAPAPKPKAGGGSGQPKPKAPATTAAAKPPEKPKSEIDLLLERKYPVPQILPLMQIVDNWNNVPPNAYPQQVALTEKASFTLKGPNGEEIGSTNMAPGTMVQPARLDGTTLTIVSLANRAMRTQVEVDATDFKQRIEQTYHNFIERKTAYVETQREKARKVLMAKPEAVAAASNATWDSADDPRFAPVKASLSANDIRTVKPEEATGFRWAGTQNISGDEHRGSFDTVVVSFDVNTIFGVFPTEWMALLKGGKVVGWVDPFTHESTAL
jgi:hypothetical protein